MIKIFVYAADQQLAEQTVQRLNEARAEHVEVLGSLKIPARPPKENRYLFICETPAAKLSALAPKVLAEADYAQELSQWYEAQSQIVTTAPPQKKRSIVVTSGQVVDAKRLLTSINDQWGLSLKVQDSSAPAPATKEPLLAYLVQNLIEQTPPLKELAIQINTLAGIEDDSIHETDAITGYRELMSQQGHLNHQNQTLENIQTDLRSQLTALTTKCEALASQLCVVQTEKEKIALESDSFKQNTLKEITELQARQQSLQTSYSNLDAQLKDTTEENELLLHQLHQVQEELEHYFLKCNDLEKQHAWLQNRWQNLLKQYPDYIGYESVSVIPVDGSQSGSDQTLLWEFEGLESATVSRSHIRFETFIESGVLGVRFHRNDKSKETSTLVSWPSIAKDLNIIECIPAGHGERKKLRARILRDLSTSDWQLLALTPKLVTQVLNANPDLQSTVTNVIASAKKLEQLVSLLPETLRTDAIVLKNYQVNSDYEHLWFELNNLRMGQLHWPKFEIRFGAGQLRSGKFTQHPKIEIPLIDGTTKPFEGWFEESKDDFGPKWELRFNLKKEIFDAEMWGELEEKEQILVRNLINLLTQKLPEALSQNMMSQHIQSQWISTFSKCAQILNRN